MLAAYNCICSCLLCVSVKDVPFLVEVCIGIIEDHGLDNQGLYRVPGQAGVVNELKEQLDRVSVYIIMHPLLRQK